MDRNYFLVRAMDSSQQSLNVFFENDVVAVGWSDSDLPQLFDPLLELHFQPARWLKIEIFSTDITASGAGGL